MPSGAGAGDARYIVWLDTVPQDGVALVGGKGASLARLAAAGLAVPAGFCVATAAFEELVDGPAVAEHIAALEVLDATDTAALGVRGRQLRELIGRREVPDTVREAVGQAYAALGATAVAVRSSATVEDLPGMSVAGQHDTFLNVLGESALLDAVRGCMASLFTDRAISYRARNGIDHKAVAMGVVVQRMLDPQASGIAFTADPVTGNRHVVSIEANLGLGETLVSGQSPGDVVQVDSRSGAVLAYEIGDKAVMSRPVPEGGTETVELASERRTGRVLTGPQARRIAATSRRIERLFDSPQDIEWALEDGTLWVLQARPITSLFPLPSPAPTDGRLHVYLSIGHMQAFPEALPPLVVDVWRDFNDEPGRARGPDERRDRRAVEAGGRVYVDLTPLLRTRVLRRLLPKVLAAGNEPASGGLSDLLRRRGDEFARTQRPPLRIRARTVWRAARGVGPLVPKTLGRLVRAFVGPGADASREEAWYDRWGRRNAASITEPGDPGGRARAALDRLHATHFVGDLYPQISPLFAALAAGRILARRFPEAPELVNAVGGGFEHDVVTRINLGLGDLADVARAHPPVARALRAGVPLGELRSVAGGAAFVAAFEEYLDEFGHRAAGELDLSRPRWREDPSPLLRTVVANLANAKPGEHRDHVRRIQGEAEAAAARLERMAATGAFGPLRRLLVRRLIRTHRGWVWLREHPKQAVAHVLAASRHALLEAGERLAADDLLHAPDDVWLLHKDELLLMLQGCRVTVDIEARRAALRRHKAMNAPPLLTSEGESLAARPTGDLPEGTLVGTPVSAGVVEGVARVVRDPAETTLEKGEILVAPSTDPGWTPLFLNAAGLVSEVGGRISHGALVAREYRLPAVVSVAGATSLISTGQRVRVDGAQGTVTVLP